MVSSSPALRENNSNNTNTRQIICGRDSSVSFPSLISGPYAGPSPTIITAADNDLSRYSTVLAKRPPPPCPPPCRRQLRDAVRCARSGMVPGAMRKYLQTKNKNQQSDEQFVENNNNIDNIEIQQDEIVPNTQNEHEVNNNDMNIDVNVEDEIIAPSSSCVNVSNNNLNNCNNNNNNEMSRKRHFSEAFSPDTTTPTDVDNNDVSTTSSSTEFDDETSEPSERFEIQLTTPLKKPKATRKSPPKLPPIRKHRKAKKTNSSSSSPVNPAGVCRNLLSSIEVLQNIQSFTPTPTYTVSETVDLSLEKALSRNSWRTVIQTLTNNLEIYKLLPHPRHVGLLIRKALLGVGVRVPRDIPADAQAFVAKLVATYPIDAEGDNSTKYYVDVFAQSGDDDVTSKKLPNFLSTLLDVIIADVCASRGTQQGKQTPAKALPFFKLLTRLVVTQYKAHEKLIVKLHRPFFVRFLEDETGIGGSLGLNYNDNCRSLLRHMFELINNPQELEPLLRWIGLLSHHLKAKDALNSGFTKLVEDFVETVSKPEHLNNQIKIVQAIRDKALGSAVCLSLLTKSLHFEYITEENEDNSSHFSSEPKGSPTLKDIIRYFKNIAKSNLIVSLKAGLEEKCKGNWQSQSPPALLPPPPPHLANNNSCSNKRRSSGVNMKGESHLHKLCAKSSSDAAGLELERFLRQKAFPVNPRDNFGNTPLHDAVAHSRLDALMKFYEFSAEPALPHDIRIDILAQNDNGDNAFHLAASLPICSSHVGNRSEVSTPLQLIEILTYIAEKLNVTEEALKTLNKDGLMPFQMTSSKEIREKLLPPDGPEVVNIPPEGVGIKVASRSRVALQTIEVKRLIALWSEFTM